MLLERVAVNGGNSTWAARYNTPHGASLPQYFEISGTYLLYSEPTVWDAHTIGGPHKVNTVSWSNFIYQKAGLGWYYNYDANPLTTIAFGYKGYTSGHINGGNTAQTWIDW